MHLLGSDLNIAFNLKKECFRLEKLRTGVLHKKVGPIVIVDELMRKCVNGFMEK